MDKVGLLNVAIVQLVPSILGSSDARDWRRVHQALYSCDVIRLFRVLQCMPDSCPLAIGQHDKIL